MTTPDSTARSDSAAAELAKAWRCGVSTGVEVTDRVLALMKKSRSKPVQRFAALLDDMMQDVMDARHAHDVFDYPSAFDAHKKINVAADAALSKASPHHEGGR
jgi:hypothetical protein